MPSAVINISFGEASENLFKKVYESAKKRAEIFLPFSSYINICSNPVSINGSVWRDLSGETHLNSSTDEELEGLIRKEYDSYININRPEINSVNFNLAISLSDSNQKGLIIKIAECIYKLKKRDGLKSHLHLLIFSNNLNDFFTVVPSSNLEQRSFFYEIQESLKAFQLDWTNLLFENYNPSAIIFDKQDFLRFLCEINNTFVFHNPEIYNGLRQYSNYVVGFSTLYFDYEDMREYLKTHAYIHLIEKEGNDPEEIISLKDVAGEAKNILEPFEFLYNCFNEKSQKGRNDNSSQSQNIETLAKSLLMEIRQKILYFIGDEKISINKKRALFAYLLGEDDKLLQGYNLLSDHNFIDRITLDDCEYNLAKYIFALNKEDTGTKTSLTDIKEIRQKIQNVNSRIRILEEQIENSQSNTGTLTSDTIIINENGDLVLNNKVQKKNLIVFTNRLDEQYEKSLSVIPGSIDLRNSFNNTRSYKNDDPEINALVAVYEYFFKVSGSNLNFSTEFFKNQLDKNFGNKNTYELVEYLNTLKQGGICQKSTYVDAKIGPEQSAIDEAKQFTLKSALNILNDEKVLKSALAEGFPVVLNLKIFKSSLDYLTKGNAFLNFPSDEEINTGLSLNQTFILCGYADKEKVFIAQNTLGNSLASERNCFIPFEYLKEFFVNAFLITEINGLDTTITLVSKLIRDTVIFNVTDENIIYQLRKNKLSFENYIIRRLNRRYELLRREYQEEIEKVGDPMYRQNLIIQRVKDFQENIKTEEENLRRIEQEISDLRNRHSNFYENPLVLVITSIIVAFFVILKRVSSGYYLISSFLLMLAFYFYNQQSVRRNKIKELEAERESCVQRIATLKNEIISFKECSQIYSVLIDGFSTLKMRLIKKYKLFSDLIDNLNHWYICENNRKAEFITKSVGPFFPLIDYALLEEYFNDKKNYLFDDVKITKEFQINDNHSLNNDELIKALKIRLNSIINSEVIASIKSDFNIVDYIKGQKYSYLKPTRNISEYFGDLQRCSKPFFRVNSIQLNPQNYYWFLHGIGSNGDNLDHSINTHFNPKPMLIEKESCRNQLTFVQATPVNHFNETVFLTTEE